MGAKIKKMVCKNGYFWNPINCTFEKSEYLASIIDGLVIMRDEIIEATKNSSTKAVSTETILTKNTSTKTFPKLLPFNKFLYFTSSY